MESATAPASPPKFSVLPPILSLPSAPLPPSSLLATPSSSAPPPDLSTVMASLASSHPGPGSPARTKDGLIRMLLQSGDPATARLVSLIQLDHSYSKPWSCASDQILCQPTRTLFVPRVSRHGAVETGDTDPDPGHGGLLDVVTEAAKPSPGYDLAKARKLMGECERFTCFTRPSLASSLQDTDGDTEEEMEGWEDRLPRDSWSPAQARLWAKVMKVLGQDRLARLAGAGGDQEPITRRLSVDKSCKRMRSVLASPPCVWERGLVQWLHHTASTHLPRPLLAAWLDILQSLKAKVPGLMERILSAAGGHHIDLEARHVAQEGLQLLLRRPWDPAEGSLATRRLARLPGNPVIVVAPPGPDNRENKTMSSRMRFWNNQMGSLGKVIVINMPPPRGEAAQRTPVNFYLHQMVSATLSKIREIKSSSGDRPVVAVGWGPGAAIAAHVATIERLAGLVCLGFPVSTLGGPRGQTGDTLLDLRTPGLFVVGERAAQCNTDDIEDIREKMRVETGLVIVGGADDQLRLTNRKKKAELVTQAMVDKSIIEQVRSFLATVLMKQSQAAAEKESQHESFAIPNQEGSGKKMKPKKRGVDSLGRPTFVSTGKKFKSSSGMPSPAGPPGSPLMMMPTKVTPKKTRRPKKLKVAEAGPGSGFTLSSGTITPLPASLLSISAPLPPSPHKEATDPPPLPIRIPGPDPAVPRTVIHYAGPGPSKTEAPATVTNNPTTPTWTVAAGRPVAAPRPAPGQLLLSSFHRNLSPTKLVGASQGQVSPRGASGLQLQVPGPGLVRAQGGSPDKLLILMSPGKEAAGGGVPRPQQVSPTRILVSPPKQSRSRPPSVSPTKQSEAKPAAATSPGSASADQKQ